MLRRILVLSIFSAFLLGVTGCYTVLWTPDQNAYSYYKPEIEDTLGNYYPGPYPDPVPRPYPPDPCYHCDNPPVWWADPPSSVDRRPIRTDGIGRETGDRNPGPTRINDLPKAGGVQPYRPPTGKPTVPESPRERERPEPAPKPKPVINEPVNKGTYVPESTPAPAPVQNPAPANDSGSTRERSNDNNNDNSSSTRSTGGGRR